MPLSHAEMMRRCRARLRGEEVPPRYTIVADFWANAKDVDGCWVWQRGLTTDGYARVWRDGRQQRGHRVALELTLGRPLGPGMKACHTCDNPPCIRPDHLFEGTQSANLFDMYSKGRRPSARKLEAA